MNFGCQVALACVAFSLSGCQLYRFLSTPPPEQVSDRRAADAAAVAKGLSPARLSPDNVDGLKPVLSGDCDSSAQHSGESTVGTVRSAECVNGKLSVVVHLPAGSEPFSVTVTSVNSLGTVKSEPVQFTRTAFACPDGYVGVPGSGIEGLGSAAAKAGHESPWLNTDKDFCVMKYPAKNNGSGVAVSVAEGKPWFGIQRGIDENTEASAFKACRSAGEGFRLISNTQWQTIARSAELMPANWSEGKVGKGSLARGHSDNSSGTLASGKDDEPYFGTGNNDKEAVGKGWEEKRTRVLSNGEVVWDFGGNVWQWVSDDTATLGVEGSIADDFDSMNHEQNPAFKNLEKNKLLFAPRYSYEKSQNVGQIAGGKGGAMLRGGYCSNGEVSGLFTVSLNGHASDANFFNGFRCAYMP